MKVKRYLKEYVAFLCTHLPQGDPTGRNHTWTSRLSAMARKVCNFWNLYLWRKWNYFDCKFLSIQEYDYRLFRPEIERWEINMAYVRFQQNGLLLMCSELLWLHFKRCSLSKWSYGFVICAPLSKCERHVLLKSWIRLQ